MASLLGTILIAMVGIVLPVRLATAQIYVIENPDGSTRFTNKPPPAGAKATVFAPKGVKFSMTQGSASYSYGGKLFKDRYGDIITAAARRERVDPYLVRAVIHTESSFNPRAVSPKGARGLMQLMPATAKMYNVSHIHDPNQNISAGVKHLAMLIGRFKGDIRLALAAYNAGEGAVEEYNGIPPYRETIHYVRRVTDLYRRYKAALHS